MLLLYAAIRWVTFHGKLSMLYDCCCYVTGGKDAVSSNDIPLFPYQKHVNNSSFAYTRKPQQKETLIDFDIFISVSVCHNLVLSGNFPLTVMNTQWVTQIDSYYRHHLETTPSLFASPCPDTAWCLKVSIELFCSIDSSWGVRSLFRCLAVTQLCV